jgi:hypothetical protein
MTQLLGKFFRYALMIYVFVFAYQWWRPMPEGLTQPSITHDVPDKGVHFIADATYLNPKGILVSDRHIWSEVMKMIDGAQHMVLIDTYFYNDLGLSAASSSLPYEFTQHLLAKRENEKHVPIALITDPVNTLYGGRPSIYLEKIRSAGVLIIETDLRDLPDSNLIWSSLWRPFLSWWGNSTSGGWLLNPLEPNGSKITLRSWFSLLNLKSNGTKLFVADQLMGDTSGKHAPEQKVVTLITSADLSENGSSTNVALKIDDNIWKDVIQNEGHIAELSNSGIPSFAAMATDTSGNLHVTLLHQAGIQKKMLEILNRTKQNDHIAIAMRYLSDRDTIDALKRAAGRGVTVQIILDPNNGAGWVNHYGIPNQPVAKEIVNGSGAEVEWCSVGADVCSAKLFMGTTGTSTFLMLGSADMTRRNIGGYNLETDVLVESSESFTAWKDANTFFNKMWANDGGTFTSVYGTHEDQTLWKSSLYRIMERTGINWF